MKIKQNDKKSKGTITILTMEFLRSIVKLKIERFFVRDAFLNKCRNIIKLFEYRIRWLAKAGTLNFTDLLIELIRMRRGSCI
ncbi:hypothetical protein B5C00_05670 [Staphylococcus delphini]|nr:hypothetical protein B5C00_05670 [Staphylococcus delphini]